MSADAARAEAALLSRRAALLVEELRRSRWAGVAAPAPEGPKAAALPKAAPPDLSPGPAPALPAVVAAAPAGPAPFAGEPLPTLAERVAGCRLCDLHLTRKTTVFGEGAERARLMFVGEAPGAEEDRQGRPFVGAAGRLLDKIIAAMGLRREEVYIANVLKCRPPGNRDPGGPEIRSCLPYLEAQIDRIEPEVLCTLGKFPLQALLQVKDPISRLRGRWHEFRGLPLMPTFHPAYLLRNEADKGLTWQDMQQVMARLELPLPEGSR